MVVDLSICAFCRQKNNLGHLLDYEERVTKKQIRFWVVGTCCQQCYLAYHSEGLHIDAKGNKYWDQSHHTQVKLYLSCLTRIFSSSIIKMKLFCVYRLFELDLGHGMLILKFDNNQQLLEMCKTDHINVAPHYKKMDDFAIQCNLRTDNLDIFQPPANGQRTFWVYVIIGLHQYLFKCVLSSGNDYFLLSTKEVPSKLMFNKLTQKEFLIEPQLRDCYFTSTNCGKDNYTYCWSRNNQLHTFIFVGNRKKEDMLEIAKLPKVIEKARYNGGEMDLLLLS